MRGKKRWWKCIKKMQDYYVNLKSKLNKQNVGRGGKKAALGGPTAAVTGLYLRRLHLTNLISRHP